MMKIYQDYENDDNGGDNKTRDYIGEDQPKDNNEKGQPKDNNREDWPIDNNEKSPYNHYSTAGCQHGQKEYNK
eukprot:13824945-Ditylum_brightwellii.AAC.1